MEQSGTRPAITQSYNPKAGYLVTVLNCASSIVPSVMQRAEFWGFMGLHFLIYGSYRLGYLEGAHKKYFTLHVDPHDVKIISAITTFFEVFYTNACYKRYLALYSCTRRMISAAYDVCFVLRLYIRHCSSDVTALYDRVGARWIVMTLMLFLYELKNMESTTDREWRNLKQMNLVRPEEIEFLKSLSPEQRLLVMLHACGDLGKTATKAVGAPANYLKDIIAKLLVYRSAQQEVIDIMNLPIPFEYFHLLNMMVVMNCLVWAYFMGSTESYFAPLCYFFATLIFMGMMDLASQLSNPFGNDQVDFPVNEWMEEFMRNMRGLISYEQESTGDELVAELKKELHQERKWTLQLERYQIDEFLDEALRPPPSTQDKKDIRAVHSGVNREASVQSYASSGGARESSGQLRESTYDSSGRDIGAGSRESSESRKGYEPLLPSAP